MKHSPALLLLPGLICDSTVWAGQVAALGSSRDLVVADYEDARTIEAMAAIALEMAPAEHFAVAGHSMGGRVALELLSQAPERVAALALLDTGIHPVGIGEAAKRYELRDLGQAEGMEALVEAWLPPMLHPLNRANAAVYEPLREMCLRAGMAGYEAQIEALLSRPDPRPILPTIRCPTLVGTGSHDRWSPVEQHQEIARHIPNSKIVVFEGAGHMAPFENPVIVTRALTAWLQNIAITQEELQ